MKRNMKSAGDNDESHQLITINAGSVLKLIGAGKIHRVYGKRESFVEKFGKWKRWKASQQRRMANPASYDETYGYYQWLDHEYEHHIFSSKDEGVPTLEALNDVEYVINDGDEGNYAVFAGDNPFDVGEKDEIDDFSYEGNEEGNNSFLFQEKSVEGYEMDNLIKENAEIDLTEENAGIDLIEEERDEMDVENNLFSGNEEGNELFEEAEREWTENDLCEEREDEMDDGGYPVIVLREDHPFGYFGPSGYELKDEDEYYTQKSCGCITFLYKDGNGDLVDVMDDDGLCAVCKADNSLLWPNFP